MAQAKEFAGPSELYVVSQFFSDNGPAFYYRVIEVKPDGSDSLIRYARIAPANLYCPRVIVQAAEARVRNTSPAQLVKSNNPCAVRPGAFHAALKRYAQRASVLEAESFGIVAQCGASSVTLGLPIAERVNLDGIRQTHPEMVRLWDLPFEIAELSFGPKEIFHDRTEEDDLALQRAGERFVKELASGRYDKGLAAAVKGNVGTWHSPSFRSLLSSYQGPIGPTEANSSYVPQLLNVQSYRFSHFVPPKYPLIALQARIQGKVELQLTVEPATGEVRNASAVSGHPLLQRSAIDAAKQWRFAPNSVDSEGLKVTLDFALRCP